MLHHAVISEAGETSPQPECCVLKHDREQMVLPCTWSQRTTVTQLTVPFSVTKAKKNKKNRRDFGSYQHPKNAQSNSDKQGASGFLQAQLVEETRIKLKKLLINRSISISQELVSSHGGSSWGVWFEKWKTYWRRPTLGWNRSVFPLYWYVLIY